MYEIVAPLTLIGGIIVLGFVSRLIFERTGIPDVMWLLLLGLLLGPIYQTINPTLLSSVAPVFAALALAMILFDAGLNMEFYKVLREFPRATLLAVLNLIFSMIFVAVISIMVFRWPVLHGLLLGAIVGGSSSAIVVPIVQGLKIREKITTTLSLESAITDALCVVAAITIIKMIALGTSTVSSIAHNIIAAFSIGAVVGIIVGIIWLYTSEKIRDVPFSYTLNLAALLLIYAAVEYVEGSGAIGVLFFGIILGNGKSVSTILRLRKKLEINRDAKTFQTDLTFFIRTFFFVFLGMLVSVQNIKSIIILGVALGLILLLARIIPVKVSTMRSDVMGWEERLMTVMMPRGLAAAVLAQMPLLYGISHADVFSDLVFIIILVSTIVCILGVIMIKIPVIGGEIEKKEEELEKKKLEDKRKEEELEEKMEEKRKKLEEELERKKEEEWKKEEEERKREEEEEKKREEEEEKKREEEEKRKKKEEEIDKLWEGAVDISIDGETKKKNNKIRELKGKIIKKKEKHDSD